jgi:hypothetical protein
MKRSWNRRNRNRQQKYFLKLATLGGSLFDTELLSQFTYHLNCLQRRDAPEFDTGNKYSGALLIARNYFFFKESVQISKNRL